MKPMAHGVSYHVAAAATQEEIDEDWKYMEQHLLKLAQALETPEEREDFLLVKIKSLASSTAGALALPAPCPGPARGIDTASETEHGLTKLSAESGSGEGRRCSERHGRPAGSGRKIPCRRADL